MVSQDITVMDQKDTSQVELTDLGTRWGVQSVAGVADKEQRTMADKLMTITTSFRDPYHRGLTRQSSGLRD